MTDFEWWLRKHGGYVQAYASISPEYAAFFAQCVTEGG